MVKTFRSAREVFRYYFPKQFEKEETEKLRVFEQRTYWDSNFVEKLLEDFESSLEG